MASLWLLFPSEVSGQLVCVVAISYFCAASSRHSCSAFGFGAECSGKAHSGCHLVQMCIFKHLVVLRSLQCHLVLLKAAALAKGVSVSASLIPTRERLWVPRKRWLRAPGKFLNVGVSVLVRPTQPDSAVCVLRDWPLRERAHPRWDLNQDSRPLQQSRHRSSSWHPGEPAAYVFSPI